MIREMIAADAEEVLAIYAYGVSARNATFETRVPTWRDSVILERRSAKVGAD